MSAIAGICRFDGPADGLREACGRMLAAQRIYGPHDGAQWDDNQIAMGRRLFRLLPEDVHDRQPQIGGHGRLALVADLRLDNRDELIVDLRLSPDEARGMADAAILMAAWERWGEDCFEHLLGDYAFALWDGGRRRLVLARDPTGQRPLHFHAAAGCFAFASMPKGLHALPEVPVRPDEAAVVDFLALLSEFGSASFFDGVERVEPGCLLIVDRTGHRSRQHWRPARQTLRLTGADDYAEALRSHLDRAVKVRLRGAGDAVGAHLSSGWDSSAVAATAARLLAEEHGRVVAFTAVPREGYAGAAPSFRFGDEGPLAAATAALYPNMEHVRSRSGGRSPIADLDRNLYLYDRPLMNLCNAVWDHDINRLAQERGLSVMLIGAAGNFTFSYSGWNALSEFAAKGQWLRWLRHARARKRNSAERWRGILFRSFGWLLPGPLWGQINRVLSGSSYDLRDYCAIHPMVDRGEMRRRAAERGGDLYFRPTTDTFAARVANLTDADNGNYNKGALAGWGVDYRDPTADLRLVEFCLSVPLEQYLGDGRQRALARRAIADRVPAEVLDAKDRGYQAIDWHEGLSADRAALKCEVERLGSVPAAAAALNIPRLRRLIADWPEGGWETNATIQNYRLALLRGISAGHFLRKVSGSNQ